MAVALGDAALRRVAELEGANDEIEKRRQEVERQLSGMQIAHQEASADKNRAVAEVREAAAALARTSSW